MKKQLKTILEIEKYLKDQDLQLEVTDFDHQRSLVINHFDGTKFKFTNFSLEKIKIYFNGKSKKVYLIYTEHHGTFYYFREDLKSKPIIK